MRSMVYEITVLGLGEVSLASISDIGSWLMRVSEGELAGCWLACGRFIGVCLE